MELLLRMQRGGGANEGVMAQVGEVRGDVRRVNLHHEAQEVQQYGASVPRNSSFQKAKIRLVDDSK